MKNNGIISKDTKLAFFLTLALVLLAGCFTCANAADGDLDPTFGASGKATAEFSGFNQGTSIVVQPDGKSVVAGLIYDPDNNSYSTIAVARFNPDGSVDAGFGNQGFYLTDVVCFYGDYTDVALQSDGKIVVVGTKQDGTAQNDFAVFRFTPDGQLDQTFGAGGKIVVDLFGDNDTARGVALQSDGKIVVVGTSSFPNVFYTEISLARFDSSGNFDASFGSNGKIHAAFGDSRFEGSDVVIQPDGRIVVAGTGGYPFGDFLVARFEPNGSLDPNFGSGGKVLTDVLNYDEASSVALQKDGKIVVAGGVGMGSVVTADFGLVRYNADGVPDANFGNGGKVITDFFHGLDFANDVLIQDDGKIVAAGSINPDISDIERYWDFGLARYDANGNPDLSFGNAGKVNTSFVDQDQGRGIAQLPGCRLVAAGYAWSFETGAADFALAAYQSSGCTQPPPTSSNCPRTHGYWKTHPEAWKVSSLTLGAQTYTKSELLAILGSSSATDASIVLARQLIAAKLNIANGSDAAPIAGTIVHADNLFSAYGGKLPYKIKPSTAAGQSMVADSYKLDDYNKGLLTPSCTQ